MSETPETDAASSPHIGFFSCATVTAEFARRLERERDEAHKIAERAIDDLGWFNETNAQRLQAELDQLKEEAK